MMEDPQDPESPQSARLLNDINMYPWNWAEGARRAELTLSMTDEKSDEDIDHGDEGSPTYRSPTTAAVMDGLRRGRPRADAITTLIIEGAKTENAIRCQICARVFPREKSLQAHLRTHTGERPYVCDFPSCGRAFCQSGQLKTHQRLHTGEKPFICSAPGCSSRFTHANRHCPDHPMAALKRRPVPVPISPSVEDGENNEDIIEWIKRYNKKQERSQSRTKSRSSRQNSLDHELNLLETPKSVSVGGNAAENTKKRKSRKPSKDSVSKDVKDREPDSFLPAKKFAKWSPADTLIQGTVPLPTETLLNDSNFNSHHLQPLELVEPMPYRSLESFNLTPLKPKIEAEDLTVTPRSRHTSIPKSTSVNTSCLLTANNFSVSSQAGHLKTYPLLSDFTNSQISKFAQKDYVAESNSSVSTDKENLSDSFTSVDSFISVSSGLTMTPQGKVALPPRTPTSNHGNSSLLQALASPSPVQRHPSTPSNIRPLCYRPVNMTPQSGGSLPPAHMLLTPLRNVPMPFLGSGSTCVGDSLSTPVRSIYSTPQQTSLASIFGSPSPGGIVPLTPQNGPPVYRSRSPVRRIFCTPQNRVPLQECNQSPVPHRPGENQGITRLHSPSPAKLWSPYTPVHSTPLHSTPVVSDPPKQTPLADQPPIQKAPPSPVKLSSQTVPLTPEVGTESFQSPSPMKRPLHFSLRRTPLKKRLVRSAKPSAPVRRLVVDSDKDSEENMKENIQHADTDMGVTRLSPEEGHKRIPYRDDKWLGALALVELSHGSS